MKSSTANVQKDVVRIYEFRKNRFSESSTFLRE